VHGTIDADSERGARNQLRGRGLLPLSTSPAARAEGLGAALRTRLSDADLAWLTRQLASLLAARLPLDAALAVGVDRAVHDLAERVSRFVTKGWHGGRWFGPRADRRKGP
ncbi:MAG: hypothetical protein NTT76_16700, partial [Achromobacter xylosoxidans]|nr:hypothetical protein [Achromobacter xylosoxidans]